MSQPIKIKVPKPNKAKLIKFRQILYSYSSAKNDIHFVIFGYNKFTIINLPKETATKMTVANFVSQAYKQKIIPHKNIILGNALADPNANLLELFDKYNNNNLVYLSSCE